MEAKVDAKQKVNLKSVHFGHQDPTDLGIISIVVVSVIEELRSQQYRSYDNAMYVELREQEVVTLNQPVHVDESKNEAFI